MQFKEMQEVVKGVVSEEMVKRVGGWLEGRKDGQGGFRVSEKAIDTFGYANMQVNK